MACENSTEYFGDLSNEQELKHSMAVNCIPESVFDMGTGDHEAFFVERRLLMAK